MIIFIIVPNITVCQEEIRAEFHFFIKALFAQINRKAPEIFPEFVDFADAMITKNRSYGFFDQITDGEIVRNIEKRFVY